MYLYVPTIENDGKISYARWQGFQLCYATKKGKMVPLAYRKIKTVKDLIKRTRFNRRKMGLEKFNDYGIRRIETEDAPAKKKVERDDK